MAHLDKDESDQQSCFLACRGRHRKILDRQRIEPMMRFLDYFLRYSAITPCLARLAGISHMRNEKFHNALQSPRALSFLLLLTALRVRRGLRKCAAWLMKSASVRVADSKENAAALLDDKHAINQPRTYNADCTQHSLIMPPTANDNTFPKLIFQTWKSKISVPDNYSYWSATLKQMNSAFAYFLWDDLDNRCFIAKFYPWFLPIYERYPREIYRVDAVRYFFLYQFGGLYADMDTECLRPLTQLFDSGDVWLGRMGNKADFSHSIPNAIMASRPLQEFWLLVINLLIQKAEAVTDPAAMAYHGPEALTGPVLLKQAFDIYRSADRATVSSLIAAVAARLPARIQPYPEPSQVIILEPGQWYPIDWTNALHFHLISEVVDSNVTLGVRTTRWLFPESYLVTYWTHSWKLATAV